MSGAQVIAWAQVRLGSRIGSGECFDLADQALRGTQHKSAADFGTVTPDADYVWGTEVLIGQVLAGDIIQFRNYQMRVRIETQRSDGSSSWREEEEERPHHTAIVERAGADGEITVLEQNAHGRRAVARNSLRFTTVITTETRIENAQTVTITRSVSVSGTFRFYRPQSR